MAMIAIGILWRSRGFTTLQRFNSTNMKHYGDRYLDDDRSPFRGASYCAFKTMTDLSSLKPCILSFMFEAVATLW